MKWPWQKSTLVEAFKASMQIDYMKWHDGVGYDIALISKATPEERREIEAILLERGAKDWRDVEAFAALGSREALMAASACGQHEIEVAVIDYGSSFLSADEKNAILIRALAKAEIGSGLAEALRAARKHPTPEVLEALRQGIVNRKPGLQRLFQGTLDHICGRASSSPASSS